ncbi:MAG: thrombospondin type 3 repeat-containing protein [Patescibacteria group bacterium]
MTEQFTSMSRKVQLLVGFLVLSAVVAAWQLLGLVRFPGTLEAVVGQNVALEYPDDDTDRDGLADYDESYWNTDFQDPDSDGDGYKDGEEVASGHDPLLPGPDDKILGHSDENISERFASLVIAGLTEGSLKPDNPSFEKSVNSIVEDILDHRSLTLEQASIIIVPDTAENKRRYALASAQLLATLPDSIDLDLDPQNTSSDLYSFEGSAQKIAALAKELESLSVPKIWSDFHQRLVSTLRDLQRNYAAVEVATKTDDPIARILAANGVFGILLETIPDILNEYSEKILDDYR